MSIDRIRVRMQQEKQRVIEEEKLHLEFLQQQHEEEEPVSSMQEGPLVRKEVSRSDCLRYGWLTYERW